MDDPIQREIRLQALYDAWHAVNRADLGFGSARVVACQAIEKLIEEEGGDPPRG